MLGITIGVVLVGAVIATAVTWLLGRIVFGSSVGQEWWAWWTPGAATGEEGWLSPIKVALTVAAGVGAAVALVVSYRKQRLAERNEPRDEAAAKRAEAAEQRELEKVYRDRYATAAEQMGNINATVRLAGVYAMANLADQWADQRRQCIAVLCAHLRLPWNPDETDALTSVQVQQPDGVRGIRTTTYTTTPGELEVRKTILRIIGRHLQLPEQRPGDHASWSTIDLDLHGATLPDLDWSGADVPNVRFDGATFTGIAQFEAVRFTGIAQFEATTFARNAVFEQAEFGSVRFSAAKFKEAGRFEYATFNSAAWLDGVTFSGEAGFERAKFDFASFNDATFSGTATFSYATFTENAWFIDSTFSGTAWFEKTIFGRNAGFYRATFDSGDVSFGDATFTGNASFSDATFSGTAWFAGTNFGGNASFSDGAFRGPYSFERATFEGDICPPSLRQHPVEGNASQPREPLPRTLGPRGGVRSWTASYWS